VKRLPFFLLLTTALFAQQAHYRKHGTVLLNDLTVTPGEVRTTSKAAVCSEKTPQFRNTTEKMKNEVYAEYGVDKHQPLSLQLKIGEVPLYEIDHLISLEIGGADTVKNLWPQPYYQHPGAHEKDILENWLHKQVCAGKMDLAEAQAKIRTDWYAEYLEMQKEKQ
jgi:hypothetical protein